jgi:hypothetical protein
MTARVVHFVLLSGDTACGGFITRDEAATFDALQVTCADCRAKETMSAAEILASWSKSRGGSR